MKEHPILFNTEMVRAILDGRKTQTRRIIKPQPLFLCESTPVYYDDKLVECPDCGDKHDTDHHQHEIKYPYQIGDRLWVRETWFPTTSYKTAKDALDDTNGERKAAYKADYYSDFKLVDGWKPSIHMPRWASRITLEITDIRVERVQDISEADAQAEGVKPAPQVSQCSDGTFIQCSEKAYRGGFYKLWGELYGWHDWWDINPWVWVIEFKRVEVE